MANGKLTPLAYSVFEPPTVISALKHLQRAAHIGKVEKTKDIFNQHSTYLVTGGCGGLGIELTKFMLLNGAKHIVLVSRRHEGKEAVLSKLDNRDAYVRYAKDELNGVIVEYGDISTQAGVNEILEKIYCLNMPPLRGVFHLAGVLADATIPNMTMEKLETVWAGKVAGAFTLHAATSRLNLEHFVLFSSANWILGGPGQANYSAANAALASLADFRHRLGLKAISIAWGRWGEIGMVRDLKRTVLGLKPFSTVSGINTMEHILRNSVMLGSNVMAAELSGDVKTSWLGHYVETVARVAAADLKVTDRQDRSELLPGNLKETVFKLVAKMLRISDPNKLNGAVLRDIGMDSLMRIELKNRLHRLYNVVVEVGECHHVRNYPASETSNGGGFKIDYKYISWLAFSYDFFSTFPIQTNTKYSQHNCCLCKDLNISCNISSNYNSFIKIRIFINI